MWTMQGLNAKRGFWIRLGGSVLGVFLLVSLGLYGVAVGIEHQVLRLCKTTRNLQEDNQDLQLQLDRVRSYPKVADASAKLSGLNVATDVMDVAQRHPVRFVTPTAPDTPVPAEAYGY